MQIPSNITTKFIVLLFFPPIDLQMNARQGCTGEEGGRELHTHVLSRLFRDRTLVERIRESTIFSPTIYRGNDPFEHVPASTSRGIKNFFFFPREIKMQTFSRTTFRLHKNIHIFIYIYKYRDIC